MTDSKPDATDDEPQGLELPPLDAGEVARVAQLYGELIVFRVPASAQTSSAALSEWIIMRDDCLLASARLSHLMSRHRRLNPDARLLVARFAGEQLGMFGMVPEFAGTLGHADSTITNALAGLHIARTNAGNPSLLDSMSPELGDLAVWIAWGVRELVMEGKLTNDSDEAVAANELLTTATGEPTE